MQNCDLIFRPAAPGDLERICTIIRQAQAQMRSLGSLQWQDGYPAAGDIARDTARGAGVVACLASDDSESGLAAGDVAAYAAVIFDGEPAYGALSGRWIGGDIPYVVVHRLAVADGMKRRGVARRFMLHVESMCRGRGVGSFRVDTNYDNRYMLRLFAGLGFERCGTVTYRSGERIAFEKLLAAH